MILTTSLVLINIFLLYKLNVKWKDTEAGSRQRWNQALLVGLTLFASAVFSVWLIVDFINNYADGLLSILGLILLLLFFIIRGTIYKFLS